MEDKTVMVDCVAGSDLRRTHLCGQQTLDLHIRSICIHSDTCTRALFNAPQRAKAYFLIRMGIQRNMTGGDYCIVLLTRESFVGGKR